VRCDLQQLQQEPAMAVSTKPFGKEWITEYFAMVDTLDTNELARIIHEKCAVKAKPLISFTIMRMGCLMKFFAMKSLAQVFGGLGRFRAVR